MSITAIFSAFGIGGLALAGLGWLIYHLLKQKAAAAVEEKTQQRIHEAQREIEKKYLDRPDNLSDALDRL